MKAFITILAFIRLFLYSFNCVCVTDRKSMRAILSCLSRYYFYTLIDKLYVFCSLHEIMHHLVLILGAGSFIMVALPETPALKSLHHVFVS